MPYLSEYYRILSIRSKHVLRRQATIVARELENPGVLQGNAAADGGTFSRTISGYFCYILINALLNLNRYAIDCWSRIIYLDRLLFI